MTLAERAKAAFDANDESSPWTSLQNRLAAYQGRKYGYQPAHRFLLGVVEEIGELAEANSYEESEDAIADASIYAIQYATTWRLDVGVLVAESAEAYEFDVILGRLAHIQGKHEQSTRGLGSKEAAREAVAPMLAALFSLLMGPSKPRSYLALVERVADDVTKRDPKALPMVTR